MPRTSADPNTDVITLRVPPALKAAIGEIATAEAKTVGELLRELIRQRLKEKERREFEEEARRQCLIINEAARDPNSDEAQVMRELDAAFDELTREIDAAEAAAEARRERKWK